MEKETFISKENFSLLTEEVEKKYNVVIQLAKVQGKRWAYAAGKQEVPFVSPIQLSLSENRGLLIYSNEVLKDNEIEEIKEAFSSLSV